MTSHFDIPNVHSVLRRFANTFTKAKNGQKKRTKLINHDAKRTVENFVNFAHIFLKNGEKSLAIF